MKYVLAIVVGALMAIPVMVHAQQKHDHKHGHKAGEDEHGPNGGQLVEAGKYHLELVVKGQDLSLYVYDQANKKIAASGAKATATIVGQNVKLELVPAGENLLKGAGTFEAKAATRVLISLTLAGQPAMQARFSPFHAHK